MAEHISFVELAKRVLEKASKPMTPREIWGEAQQMGITSMLKTTGKTPDQSLAARLYTDEDNFTKVGSSPARFVLRSLGHLVSNLEQEVLSTPLVQPRLNTYTERDLHPLLVIFAQSEFDAHSRTIYHEHSQKKAAKQNEWIHPDIVGFALTGHRWTNEVVQLSQSSPAWPARMFSFELKIDVSFANLRQYFFQAVSNSSWAHEGYLVAVDFDPDQQFEEELTRLSQSFGIGVIELNTTDPIASQIKLPAREKSVLDWKTVDRIAAVNSDFREFVGSVASSVKINQPVTVGFDRLLAGSDLEVYLKKFQDT
ncbi:MAG: hypothetical protein HYX68_01255 [Planctomycetes bacterium]|nr:hypothetical protein [Planctomycetota bacterium]